MMAFSVRDTDQHHGDVAAVHGNTVQWTQSNKRRYFPGVHALIGTMTTPSKTINQKVKITKFIKYQTCVTK